ncbi:MAG TPA: hypothetical protein VK534_00645 [Methylomirabilota bacterium]|nr:hypothetical protein [Methylomirabilota bacterium]
MDEPKPAPVMDVVRPAQQEPEIPTPNAPEKPAKSKPPKQPPKPKAPKKPGNGNVTAAIFATVIIVLGMATLATYAYLQQTT